MVCSAYCAREYTRRNSHVYLHLHISYFLFCFIHIIFYTFLLMTSLCLDVIYDLQHSEVRDFVTTVHIDNTKQSAIQIRKIAKVYTLVFYFLPLGRTSATNRWISARLCVSNGDISVLHYTIVFPSLHYTIVLHYGNRALPLLSAWHDQLE